MCRSAASRSSRPIPPRAVNDAFKDVTAAQQDAESARNNANAYALQLRQLAQGEATAFDKVYVQYKLSPEVTKRRMYYETMERVLRGVDKTIVETPGVTPVSSLAASPAQHARKPKHYSKGRPPNDRLYSPASGADRGVRRDPV